MVAPFKLRGLDDARALADILLAAAHSDRFYAAAEVVMVHVVLADLLGRAAVPEALAAHIRAFDPDAVDVPAACARLALDTEVARCELVALVLRIVRADAVVHEAEDAFVEQLAATLGLSADAVMSVV